MLSIQEDGVCRGSCRSIEGLNMYEALSACKEHLLQFGGHAMAAGCTIDCPPEKARDMLLAVIDEVWK